jgi:CubicO group peptidase (beta-lactamase class C family)
MGEGHLDHWEKHWNLLPFVLAAAWDKMEYSAARRMENIGQMEADLQRLERPAPAWKESLRGIPQDPGTRDAQPLHKLIMAEIGAKARTLETEQKLIIPLDHSGRQDPLILAGAWHQALKRHFSGTPSTVFMGGSMEKSFIVFFQRPLMADDFIELWSI